LCNLAQGRPSQRRSGGSDQRGQITSRQVQTTGERLARVAFKFEQSMWDVIFVEKNLEHRFFDIAEELVLLVVFAPAESG